MTLDGALMLTECHVKLSDFILCFETVTKLTSRHLQVFVPYFTNKAQ